ncbi:unnamed protein product [Cylindrotheca closterium]|uniref:Uncharacterized protein n=1 Tax=Cylindrotheca closterium TaxID=2856 RepID=A0AAD2CE26_9STRA|nr:unnamed protein product [Cylindrotheca closterium]
MKKAETIRWLGKLTEHPSYTIVAAYYNNGLQSGRLSPYYSHIRQDTIDNLVEKVEQSVREKKDNPIFISDKQSLLHEKHLGSDVGGVHQVDSMSDNHHDYFGGASTSQIEGSSHPSSNEDLPLKTHYVSPSLDTLLQTESIRKQVENDAIQNMMKSLDESRTVSQHQMESDALYGDGLENMNQKEETGITTLLSYRIDAKTQSMSSCQMMTMLACTFPWLFPIGKAYGRRSGNLNGKELNHLLKQFSMIHGQDRQMLDLQS